MGRPLRVAFVYLGGRLPKYAVHNLTSLVDRFPNLNIVLISDISENDIVEGIEFFSFDSSRISHEFASKSSLNSEFRNGFWIHTMTRFGALSSYMNSQPQISLLHFELDVWIADNFPFNVFERVNAETSFSLPSLSEGSAAVLFLRDFDSSIKLSYIFSEIAQKKPGSTDMTILREIHDSKLMDVEVLPISPDEGKVSLFNGYIFDPSTWGMYFFGQDPRNARGLQFFHRQESHHLVQPANYEVKSNGHIIKVHNKSESAFLVNLHIHSKDLRVFGRQRNEARHIQKYLDNEGASEFSEFRLKIFVDLLARKILKELKKRIGYRAHE